MSGCRLHEQMQKICSCPDGVDTPELAISAHTVSHTDSVDGDALQPHSSHLHAPIQSTKHSFFKKKLNNQTSSQRITRIYYTEHCRWQGNACVRHQNIELAVDRSCCSCRQEEHGGQHKQLEGKGEKQAPVIRNVPDSGCGLLNLCRSTENFTWLV